MKKLINPCDSAADEIEQVIGDPAYPYEIKEFLSPWSRKQMELAFKKLLQEGKIVRYGNSTRYLYATMREAHEGLKDLSAASVRLLQYMPLAGGIESRDISAVMAEINPVIENLIDARILARVVVCNRRDVLILTAYGKRLREGLGFGLELPILKSEDLEAMPKWWPLLESLAKNARMPHQGNIDIGNRLLTHGFARKVKNYLEITEQGREAYHARIDLIEITKILEKGVHDSVAHKHLAEEYQNQNSLMLRARTAVPVPQTKTKKSIVSEKVAEENDFQDTSSNPTTQAGEIKSSSEELRESRIRDLKDSIKATAAKRLAKTVYAYLLMRTDMPSMGLGKSRAQAMYAGNNMTHELYVKPLKSGHKPDDDVVAWHQSGAGFGTAVAIGARNEITLEVLKATITEAARLGFKSGLVEDEFYPYSVTGEMLTRINKSLHTKPPQRYRKDDWRCFCKEVTSGWILGDKYELEELLSKFSLTPHADRERF